MTPCYTCAKLISAAGIKRVVAFNDYHRGAKSKELFKKAGISYELAHDEVEKYPKK